MKKQWMWNLLSTVLLAIALVAALGALSGAAPPKAVPPGGDLTLFRMPFTGSEFNAIGQGLARRLVEAAAEMGIGAETVKSYLRSVMRKLGAHTRYEAVNAARRIGALP